MLIKSKKNESFVVQAPNPRPSPLIHSTGSMFNGVYVRPNPSNEGTVPARPPSYLSPDIWPAGTTAVPNYQTELASEQSYNRTSEAIVTPGMDNYFYVRGKNGSTTTKTCSVKLWWSPAHMINWPSTWQSKSINTDQNQPQANIINLNSGQISVANAPFVWREVPSLPPDDSDHYCLITLVSDVSDPTPPLVNSHIDMSDLVSRNLKFGWRNIAIARAHSDVTLIDRRVSITIPPTLDDPDLNTYMIVVRPKGLIGWDVEVRGSRPDALGRPMSIERQPITGEGMIIGIEAKLQLGFNGLFTVYLYSNGNDAQFGAEAPLSLYNKPEGDRLREAISRNLIDYEMTELLANGDEEISPEPVIHMGGDSIRILPR